ncbi:pentatricopeptide repeat-containing protein At1g66345, mitochondrial [Olea europaea var. sylvestris]|uniref:pentatricopeptide repeat-containing protein At1g66345, mitochondrial n=1 Tax=Olea europaea var. sylvestris TaxID=158386 RepID=UPI000C1D0E73|nr:pentatricopeptide repeat-containing protein At1g66345, mitochondrial [Olea europaea var. sylvestris]
MGISSRIFQPKNYTKLCIPLTFSTHNHTLNGPPQNPAEDKLVNSILESLHKGFNWTALAQKFSAVQFTNSIIQNILLQLKEPINSRKALTFFHWSAQQMNFKHGLFNYCIAIHILVKSRLIKDAKALLESALMKTSSNGNSQVFKVLRSLIDSYEVVGSIPFVFDLFIQTCAKLGMADDVLDACKFLNVHGFTLSVISFNTLLHVMLKSDGVHLVWAVYEHMVETRIYPNEVTVRIMVGALCKEGKLKKYLDIVQRMHGKRCSVPALLVNACLVYRMIEEERIENAVVLLKGMLQRNMILDNISYSLVVFAKVKMGSMGAAKQIYEEMLKRGFEGNAFVYSLFIEGYCEKGRIEEAVGLLEEMENVGLKPHDEIFNHLIKGCSTSGRLEASLKFCERMVTMGLVPSCSTVNKMFSKLCENGDAKRANEMLTVLLDKGFVPDKRTYSYLVAGYGKDDDVEGVLQLYFEMEHKLFMPDSSVFTSLIISLCRCGRLEEADKHLETMKARSFVPSSYVYETLIVGHLQKGDKMRAHKLYTEMVGE